MKSLQLFTLITLLSISHFIATAGNNTGTTRLSADAKFAYSLRTDKSSDKLILAFENQSQHIVRIKIHDLESRLVFSEVQKATPSLRKQYDLSKLTQGTYNITIESGPYVFKEQIEIGHKRKALDFDIVIAPDPHNQHKLRVGFANAKADVIVEISDENGHPVHQERFFEVENATQLLNMEFLTPGVYSIKVTSNGRSQVDVYVVD